MVLGVFDHYGPDDTVLAGNAVLVHDVYVIDGRRLARRPRLDRIESEIGQKHRRLRLPESFVDDMSGGFAESVDHFRIQRLACGAAVMDG